MNGGPGAVPQHNACGFCSSRTLLASRATVTPGSFSVLWCSVLVFYISPVFIYKQLVIWLTAGQMENFALMALHLIFSWLSRLSRIRPSLSLILSSNSKVLQFDRWWPRPPSTRQSGCGTSTSKLLLPIIRCLVSMHSPMLLPLAMGARLFEARTSLMFSLYTVPGTAGSWSMIKDPKCNDDKNNTVYITEKLLFVAKWERSAFYGCIKLSFCSSKKT